jgi:hypothetical protein
MTVYKQRRMQTIFVLAEGAGVAKIQSLAKMMISPVMRVEHRSCFCRSCLGCMAFWASP